MPLVILKRYWKSIVVGEVRLSSYTIITLTAQFSYCQNTKFALIHDVLYLYNINSTTLTYLTHKTNTKKRNLSVSSDLYVEQKFKSSITFVNNYMLCETAYTQKGRNT
jgi:hypothetical protein